MKYLLYIVFKKLYYLIDDFAEFTLPKYNQYVGKVADYFGKNFMYNDELKESNKLN